MSLFNLFGEFVISLFRYFFIYVVCDLCVKFVRCFFS